MNFVQNKYSDLQNNMTIYFKILDIMIEHIVVRNDINNEHDKL